MNEKSPNADKPKKNHKLIIGWRITDVIADPHQPLIPAAEQTSILSSIRVMKTVEMCIISDKREAKKFARKFGYECEPILAVATASEAESILRKKGYNW